MEDSLQQEKNEKCQTTGKNKYLNYLVYEMLKNGSKYLKDISYDYSQKRLEKKQDLSITISDETSLPYSYFELTEKLFKFPIKKTQLMQIIKDTNKEVNNAFQSRNKLILSDYITEEVLKKLNSYKNKLFNVNNTTKGIFNIYSNYYSMPVLPEEEKEPILVFLNSFFTKIINREKYIKEQKYKTNFTIENETFLKTMTEAQALMIYETQKRESEQYEEIIEDIYGYKEKTIVRPSRKMGEGPLPSYPFLERY